MSTSEQTETELLELIKQGQTLDCCDSDGINRWVRASLEALRSYPVHQAKFDEYCCSAWGPTFMRVCLGVWMLKQPLLRKNCVLDEEIREERSIPWEPSCWSGW